MRATALAPVSRGLMTAGLLCALSAPMDAQRSVPAGFSADGSTAAASTRMPARPPRKSGMVAFGLGYLFPGAGHFYAGESWRGASILGVVTGGTMFAMSDEATDVAAAAVLVSFGTYLWSMVDAPLAARRHNRRVQGNHAVPAVKP